MSSARSAFFGKYLVLLIAIGAFFALSVSIFSLNYRLSARLAEDAARINDSGKIRGLTQQHAKAILALSHEIVAEEPVQTSMAQLSESYLALDETLVRANAGAAAANIPAELELLAKFEKFWRPLAESSKAIVGKEMPEIADVRYAFAKSNANNVRLMQLADDLTLVLEEAAAARGRNLVLIQAVAIALASLNFLFIVLHALRSLRRSDRIAEAAQRETGQILGAVREGLFLIDRDGAVGSQRSGMLEKVFPRPLPPDANFLLVLEPLVSRETMKSASEYIGLLFNKRVKASLLQSLNPLLRVEIKDGSSRGRASTYLSFDFHPVCGADKDDVTALLVSTVDISQQVHLEQELASAEERSRTEIGLLVGILANDPGVVKDYLSGAIVALGDINEELRLIKSGPGNYSTLINGIFRAVHSIKGEAAALTLDVVARQAHDFEDTLSALRNRDDLRGEDLIPVAAGIGGLLQEISKVRLVVDKIGAYGGGKQVEPAAADEDIHHVLQRIQRLTLAVAADLQKPVRVETSLGHIDEVPAPVLRMLKEGLPQLVRNAVAHGIEPAGERLRSGKETQGRVRIELRHCGLGGLELLVEDDGRGIDVEALRGKLLANGRHDAQEVAAMSDREVVGMIFQPGFSTADAVDEHAGRGVGLDVLLALVRETGARLRVASTPRSYTRFVMHWSPAT